MPPPGQKSRKGAGAAGELRHQLQPGMDSSLDADLGSTAWFSEEDYFEGRAGSNCMPVESTDYLLTADACSMWLDWGCR